MISHLKGTLEEYGDDWAVIDVNGVGYSVLISESTKNSLPNLGGPLKLLIEAITRNEVQQLCGFSSDEERQWFRLLLNVQGVGAKVALSILSLLSLDDLSKAIINQDSVLIQRTPGVGAKLANRIVLELRDKKTIPLPLISNANDHTQDALAALLTLGYSRQEALNAVRNAQSELGVDQSIGEFIKLALNKVHSGK